LFVLSREHRGDLDRIDDTAEKHVSIVAPNLFHTWYVLSEREVNFA
jgi:hypothetical protein